MATKRKQTKKQRFGLTLLEKVAVLDLLKTGMSIASVARKYFRNESSIRAIKKREKEIRQAVSSSAPVATKVMTQVRDESLVKMEKILFSWLENRNSQQLPIDGNMLRIKALEIYKQVKTPSRNQRELTDGKTFRASLGWLNSFKHRFKLKCVKINNQNPTAASKTTWISGEYSQLSPSYLLDSILLKYF